MSAGNPAAHERGRKAGGVCNLQRGRAAGGWNADSGATVCQPASYGICLCNDRRRRCSKTGNGDVGAPGRVVLDEMAEFKRQTLDVLRQPMEEGKIFLARSRGNFVYPADFMLLGATNPCPCGYYPDRNRCRCQDWEVRRYLARLSGPLLDRMDLCCQIKQTPIRKLWEKREASYIDSDKNGSKWMREQVLEARKRQQMRCRGAAMRENGRLSPGEILKYCPLGLEEQEFLEQASEQAGLSMRGCHRVIRVARTIADLEGKDRIGVEHLGQALFFRNQNVLRE